MSLNHAGNGGGTPHRSGYVAVAGKPNVGKSTLMNRIVGAKISIVTDKPQTTRNRMLGILTRPDAQLIFIDTPGLIQAEDKLNRFLREQAEEGLRGADLIYHLVDCNDRHPRATEVARALQNARAEKFLIYNKIDCLKDGARAENIDAENYAAVFRVSALTGQGVDELVEASVRRMPAGPRYFDADVLTDRDMRFLAAELVREKIYECVQEELPYSIATQVEEYREQPGRKTFIRVNIFVERESQKRIVIGREGQLLKQIGEQARREIEVLSGEPVFLELWVKTRKNWTNSDVELRRMGYAGGTKKRRQ